MPEWIKGAGFYYVQPTSDCSNDEYKVYLDKLFAKIEAAKLKQKGMTA